MPAINGLHANNYHSNRDAAKNAMSNGNKLKLSGCSNKPTYGDNSVGYPHNYHSRGKELYNLVSPPTEPLDSNCPPPALKGSWFKKNFVNLMLYTDIVGIKFQQPEKKDLLDTHLFIQMKRAEPSLNSVRGGKNH